MNLPLARGLSNHKATVLSARKGHSWRTFSRFNQWVYLLTKHCIYFSLCSEFFLAAVAIKKKKFNSVIGVLGIRKEERYISYFKPPSRALIFTEVHKEFKINLLEDVKLPQARRHARNLSH